MKKLIILAIGVLFAGAVNAQTFGVKGGLNFSNIIKTNDENFNTEFKTGFNAGLFAADAKNAMLFSNELEKRRLKINYQ